MRPCSGWRWSRRGGPWPSSPPAGGGGPTPSRGCAAGARLIARIDSRSGVERRAEIIAAADTVVVGRAHLAAELPIEQVPFLQKAIAREGAAAGTPVWVTTGRSGISAGPTATVAEANDIVNLLLDGVSGLVLTGESA